MHLRATLRNIDWFLKVTEYAACAEQNVLLKLFYADAPEIVLNKLLGIQYRVFKIMQDDLIL